MGLFASCRPRHALHAVQALEAMPVIEAAAPAPACDPCKALSQEQLVPAGAEMQPLQPSKLAVWKLWMDQVRQATAAVPTNCPGHGQMTHRAVCLLAPLCWGPCLAECQLLMSCCNHMPVPCRGGQ